jgi:hypothetical protein
MPRRIVAGFPAHSIDRVWIDCWDGTWRIKTEPVYGFVVIEDTESDPFGDVTVRSIVSPICDLTPAGEWRYESPLDNVDDFAYLGLVRHDEPLPLDIIEMAERIMVNREKRNA